MRSSWDNKQFFVPGIRVRFAHDMITLGLALHHILIGSFAKITGMGFFAMHDENGRTNLIDVVEETGIGICLCADGTPAVVRVAAAFVVATLGDIIVVIVLYELGCVIWQRIHYTTGRRTIVA